MCLLTLSMSPVRLSKSSVTECTSLCPPVPAMWVNNGNSTHALELWRAISAILTAGSILSTILWVWNEHVTLLQLWCIHIDIQFKLCCKSYNFATYGRIGMIERLQMVILWPIGPISKDTPEKNVTSKSIVLLYCCTMSPDGNREAVQWDYKQQIHTYMAMLWPTWIHHRHSWSQSRTDVPPHSPGKNSQNVPVEECICM